MKNSCSSIENSVMVQIVLPKSRPWRAGLLAALGQSPQAQQPVKKGCKAAGFLLSTKIVPAEHF
jgi:hypothetical protein